MRAKNDFNIRTLLKDKLLFSYSLLFYENIKKKKIWIFLFPYPLLCLIKIKNNNKTKHNAVMNTLVLRVTESIMEFQIELYRKTSVIITAKVCVK